MARPCRISLRWDNIKHKRLKFRRGQYWGMPSKEIYMSTVMEEYFKEHKSCKLGDLYAIPYYKKLYADVITRQFMVKYLLNVFLNLGLLTSDWQDGRKTFRATKKL
ncbi:hypothetical protein CMI37_30085 [Candidatus Pacearchaeota archaeon]|nr:hypothetical protein [Candidatus Pacearchaeota archaeon]